MNSVQILRDLDKHAAEFNFPMLDNAYLEFAAARLSAFRGDKDWLVVFEVLGFSEREIEFTDGIYAYGSCIGGQGFVGEEIPVSSLPEQPLFDGVTNQCVADWSSWSVRVGDEKMSFSPTREEYAAAGILIDREPSRGSLREIELLRFLVHRLGATKVFMSDELLLNHFPNCRNLKKFVQTTQWQHPDVAEEEKPSKNLSIRSLIEALSSRDKSLFKPGVPNTLWGLWDQTT